MTRPDRSPRFTAEQVMAASRRVAEAEGVITWDAPVETSGRIPQPFVEQLTGVGQALRRRP